MVHPVSAESDAAAATHATAAAVSHWQQTKFAQVCSCKLLMNRNTRGTEKMTCYFYCGLNCLWYICMYVCTDVSVYLLYLHIYQTAAAVYCYCCCCCPVVVFCIIRLVRPHVAFHLDSQQHTSVNHTGAAAYILTTLL